MSSNEVNKVAALAMTVIMSSLCAAIGVMVGTSYGIGKMQNQAVLEGHATWSHNINGSPVFHWKEVEDAGQVSQ